jgi:hypothetical protein
MQLLEVLLGQPGIGALEPSTDDALTDTLIRSVSLRRRAATLRRAAICRLT